MPPFFVIKNDHTNTRLTVEEIADFYVSDAAMIGTAFERAAHGTVGAQSDFELVFAADIDGFPSATAPVPTGIPAWTRERLAAVLVHGRVMGCVTWDEAGDRPSPRVAQALHEWAAQFEPESPEVANLG